MIFALLSDLHANLEALRACLAHAEERGVERQSIEAADATYTFAGHVHEQVLYFHTPRPGRRRRFGRPAGVRCRCRRIGGGTRSSAAWGSRAMGIRRRRTRCSTPRAKR